MESYIDKLRARAAAEQDRVKASKLNKPEDARVVCDKPLTQQIEELMLSLPPVERQRRWTMAEFVARLSGRYTTRPHPMNIGQALRSLGWRQRRDWSSEGCGRRFWVASGYLDYR